MKIKQLKELVDNAYKNSKEGNAEVDCWLQLEDDTVMCDIERVGQFQVIPDMTITFKPTGDTIYSYSELTEEQLDYKKKYEELEKRLEEIRKYV